MNKNKMYCLDHMLGEQGFCIQLQKVQTLIVMIPVVETNLNP